MFGVGYAFSLHPADLGDHLDIRFKPVGGVEVSAAEVSNLHGADGLRTPGLTFCLSSCDVVSSNSVSRNQAPGYGALPTGSRNILKTSFQLVCSVDPLCRLWTTQNCLKLLFQESRPVRPIPGRNRVWRSRRRLQPPRQIGRLSEAERH